MIDESKVSKCGVVEDELERDLITECREIGRRTRSEEVADILRRLKRQNIIIHLTQIVDARTPITLSKYNIPKVFN